MKIYRQFLLQLEKGVEVFYDSFVSKHTHIEKEEWLRANTCGPL